MKILIIEDEPLAAERLESLLISIMPEVQVVGILNSVESSVIWLKKEDEPDLIVTDIQLGDSICFDIFQEIKPKCPVIFTTAYDHYAIQAFEVNSIDYLLKPIQKEKLALSLNKLKELNFQPTELPDLDLIKNFINNVNKSYKSRFLVRVGNNIQSIPVEKIAYFFTQDKLTYLVDIQDKKYPIDHTLEEIDTMLNPDHFFRLNRKYLTHYQAVTAIHPYFKGRLKIELMPAVDDSIVVSSDKTPLLKAWLDK